VSYERKTFVGNAAQTNLTAGIDASQLSITIDDATNWPDETDGPFIIAVGLGTATEEKILCTARSGTTLTVRTSTGRGHDGTTAQAHAIGATVDHVLDAETIDQASRFVNLQTTKGDLVISNGTNPVALASGATDDTIDGHVLQLSWAAATGWVRARLETVLSQGSAPAVAGYVRLWYDTGNRILRPSNGSSWQVPVQLPAVADDTARDALFSTPLEGHACHRSDYDLQEIYDGSAWVPIGVPRFTDTTARDAYFTSPADGDQAYITTDHDQYVYRSSEWVRISQKVTVAATQPASPQVGDLWFQPVT
jgi:hypothetical protein